MLRINLKKKVGNLIIWLPLIEICGSGSGECGNEVLDCRKCGEFLDLLSVRWLASSSRWAGVRGGSPLTVVHWATSCSPSSVKTCTMKGRMLVMPENCCIIKYGITSISGRRVGGRSISFHVSKLQCEDSSSLLSENHRCNFRSINDFVSKWFCFELKWSDNDFVLK
jgi:hypothetical protein